MRGFCRGKGQEGIYRGAGLRSDRGRGRKTGNELQTIRVTHISRVTLKPYEQDFYDTAGRLVEIVTYDKYQKFGDIDYPTSILITMPIYEYRCRSTSPG